LFLRKTDCQPAGSLQAVLASGSDQDFNLAVQTMRNPITAASILGTGASVG
jgi:hypothetical protein